MKNKRYVIEKIKMPYNLPGYSRGIGWEVRDTEQKKVIDVKPTKSQAKQVIKDIK